MSTPTATGIGDGMSPETGVTYGRLIPDAATTPSDFSLQWDLLPGVSQAWSASVNRKYYVYEDFGHGGGTYLVVYLEDGTISPGTMASSQYLTGQRGDRDSGRAPDLAQGFFHHRLESFVQPSLRGPSVQFGSSSPSNTNRQSAVNNQAISSSSDTISVSGDGVSGSETTGTQVWHGVSFNISEWNIVETTDVGALKASWLYYQDAGANNEFWDGRRDASQNFEWWQEAYNCGGGWDDVKPPCDLSQEVFKWHNTASWRFDKSLVSDGKLPVVFQGAADIHVISIGMPQLQNNGHHTALSRTVSVPWTDAFDIVEWSRKKT